MSVGKGYLNFYKTGISSVYANHQSVQLLKARLASTPPNPTPPLDPPPYDPYVRERRELSRAEFQQLCRHKLDMKRVPVFAVVFAVFGEWIVLIVPWITKIVPGPCRLPSQIIKEVEALEKRRVEAREQRLRDGRMQELGKKVGGEGMTNEVFAVESAQAVRDLDVRDLGRVELLDLSRTFGLHSRIWDRVGVSGGVWPPTALLRRSVRSWLKYLAADDELMAKGGEVGELLEVEVRTACMERGANISGKDMGELVKWLKGWLGDEKKTE